MWFLTPYFVLRGGILYKMIVPGEGGFVPFKSCPRGLSRAGVLNEIDTYMSHRHESPTWLGPRQSTKLSMQV